MSIVRGLRTEGIEVNCYTEAFERLQGIIPRHKILKIPRPADIRISFPPERLSSDLMLAPLT